MSDASSLHGPLGTVARINASALTHNLARVRALAPRSRVLAVIKADAYGHGLLRVARALRDADGFAVARLDEAQRLRSAGLTQRILLLPGVDRPEDLGHASRLRLDLAVHHLSQVEMLEQAPAGLRVVAWLKVDSGMHRLGIAPQGVREIFNRLEQCDCLVEPVRLMTHLSDADALEKPATPRQLEIMQECTRGLNAERSIGNSAGIIAWAGARSDWVRPGIMLYGISPFGGDSGADHELVPAMTLTTRLSAVNHLPRGGAVGYGGTFVADEEMPLGAAAAGYADGYPRHVPDGTPVLVRGVRAPRGRARIHGHHHD